MLASLETLLSPCTRLTTVHEPTRKGGAPQGAIQKSTPCGETKTVPVNEIPPTPLYKRGAANGTISNATSHLPPLTKGDRGGFYCAFVFPKITTAYLHHEHRRKKANFRSDQWESAYNILMPSLPQDVGIGQRTFAGYNGRHRDLLRHGASLLEAVNF